MYCRPTAGFTGKGRIWRKKPPDAESAVWGCFSESVGESPHLSDAPELGGFYHKNSAILFSTAQLLLQLSFYHLMSYGLVQSKRQN